MTRDNHLSPGLGRGDKRTINGMEPSLSRDVKQLRAQQEAVYRQRAIIVRSLIADEAHIEQEVSASKAVSKNLQIGIMLIFIVALLWVYAASTSKNASATYIAPIYNTQGNCTNCGTNAYPSFDASGKCTNCLYPNDTGTSPTGFTFPDIFNMPTWNNGTTGTGSTAPSVQPNMPSVPSFGNPSVPSMPSGGMGGLP